MMPEGREREKILIVDDSIAAVRILEAALKDEYLTIIAMGGSEALDAVEEDLPVLILLDISMPLMDGYEVCRRLKQQERTKNVPVIFITANDKPYDEIKAFEVGGIDYISKPIRPAIVKARVKSQLNMNRMHRLLESKVFLDDLTQIENRRCFNESLEREWRRAVRTAQCLSLIMIDIDFFKQYNDNCGHSAGDTCLKMVAHSLKNSVTRSADMVARYGGEEFAAILPATPLEGAIRVAESMRGNVEALHIPHPASSISDHVTVSLGVASCSPIRNTDPEFLVQAADAMLYKAKQMGRNQVM